MILGLLGALAAAVLYGVGTVLQSVGLRRGSAVVEGAWPDRAWAARWYAVGLALDGLGFLASVVALRTMPLFVVESAVASSVAVTALLAVLFLGVRLARRETVALLGVAAGLVALASSADPAPAVGLAAAARWLVLLLVVPLAALGWWAYRLPARTGAPLFAVVAGLGFGGTGIAARAVAVPDPWWRVVLDPLFWALLLFSAVALVAFGWALQRGSVTTTSAITFTVETVVPSLVGLALLGDHVRPGAAPVAVVGFALTLAGCVALARHAATPPDPTPRDTT